MRHKSIPLQIKENCLIPSDELNFTYRPRFSKHKNFYTPKKMIDIQYVTPTQKHAKEILDKICFIRKKIIVNERPESSFQKRKEFSLESCPTQKIKQIRIKSLNKKIEQPDWLAFILD